MKCLRCGGLMACEELTGGAPSKTEWCESWRCVNCGELIDAVIFENRTRSGVAEDREKQLAGVGRWAGGASADDMDTREKEDVRW